MLSESSKRIVLLIICLILIGILTFGVGTYLNFIFLKKTILAETATSHVTDGEFLKISHPVKIADYNVPDEVKDPDGGFFIVTVKDHEYLIYKNNLSHRFGLTHYPDCKCLKK